MKIEDYKALANRTMADLGSPEADASHMALGIASEFGELLKAAIAEDKVNTVEEHGDINWFIAGLCKIFNFGFTELYNQAKREDTNGESMVAVFEVTGYIKDYMAYGKEVDREKLWDSLVEVFVFLKHIAKSEEFDYMESLKKNIKKLQNRFPDKFTNDAAINRDTDEERKILEQ